MKNNINKVLWKKFDLHIHTVKTERDSDFTPITSKNIEEFGKKIYENNISLIAITNHNIIDLKNFFLIKNELNKYNIKTLIGVELNLKFENNKKFQANLIFNDENENFNSNINGIKKFLEEQNLNVKNKNNIFLNSNIDLKDFLQKISNFYGDYVFILDYAKSSSNLIEYEKNKEWNYHNLLSFDFVEGKNSNNIDILVNKMKEIINNNFEISQIMGTDNRNFEIYPDNNNRKGWTGTFFLSESSFHGIKQASFFPFLIYNNHNFKNKKMSLSNKKFTPILNKIFLDNFKFEYKEGKNFNKTSLNFTHGVNCIIGRRGSGKSELFKSIIKYLENKHIPFNSMEQNEITMILSNIEDKKFHFESEILSQEYQNTKLNNIKPNVIKNFLNTIFDEHIIKNYNDGRKTFLTLITELEDKLLSIFNQEINKENITTEENLISHIINQTKLKQNTIEYQNNLELNPGIQNLLNHIKLFLNNLNKKISSNLVNLFLDNFNIEKFLLNIRKFIQNNINNFLSKNYELKKNYKKINISMLKNEINTLKKQISNILNNNIKLFINNVFYGIKKLHDKDNNLILYFTEDEQIKNFSDNFYVNIKYNINDNFLYTLNNIKKLLKILLPSSIFLFNENKNIFDIVEIKNKKNNLLNIDQIITYDEEIYLFNKNISGKSPGEKVKIFIEHLININNKDSKIILIDQPEDQLDAQTVKESIIDPIYKYMQDYIQDGYQFIFVTHDPKIAINLSPTNFIICVKEDDNTYKKYQNNFADILKDDKNQIIEIVDGSKDILRKRSEIYGRK